MKRYVKYTLVTLAILITGLGLLSFAVPLAYQAWAILTPVYEIGSCVEDVQIHRIHQITGPEDRLKTGRIPTRILVRGEGVGGWVGSEDNIQANDSSIRPVTCPSAT